MKYTAGYRLYCGCYAVDVDKGVMNNSYTYSARTRRDRRPSLPIYINGNVNWEGTRKKKWTNTGPMGAEDHIIMVSLFSIACCS